MYTTTLKQLAKDCNGQLINYYADQPISGISTNSKEMNNCQIFIPLVGSRFNGHDYVLEAFKNQAFVALHNRNIPHDHIKSPLILVDDTTKALGLIARAHIKRINCAIIAITGSNGKTSTKDILFQLLSPYFKCYKTPGNRNNEIGLPLAILEMDTNTQIAILEMGMSSLNEIDYLTSIATPDLAIITNIGNAHLNDLGNLENIAKAKLEILNHTNSTTPIIMNGDNPLLLQMFKQMNYPNNYLTYGFNQNNDYVISNVGHFIDQTIFSIDPLTPQPIHTNLLGSHQAANISAALLAASHYVDDFDGLVEQLKNIHLTKQRNEIFQLNQAIIIDDSYKSNPESLESALYLLNQYQNPGVKIAVLGDMLDLGIDEISFHQKISVLIDKLKLDRLYTFGNLSQHFHDFNQVIGQHFETKEALLQAIKPWLNQNSTILFKAAHALAFDQLISQLKTNISKPSVALVCGGKGSEYSVSLSSMKSVLENFPNDLFDYHLIVIGQNKCWYYTEASGQQLVDGSWQELPSTEPVSLSYENKTFILHKSKREIKIDCAFIMCHGKYGEDGILQQVFSNADIPFTGCDAQSSILCYDKDLTHRILDTYNFRQKAKYQTFTQLIDFDIYQKLCLYLGNKMIIKPAREGSSYGISVVNDYTQFKEGFINAQKFDKKIVVEEFIQGFEVGCAILEKDGQLIIGRPDQIVIKNDFFDFEGKYEFKDASIICPAQINANLEEQLKLLATKIFTYLGCRDFSRADFFISNEQIFFNEINTIPGFTDHSRFPSMLKEINISYKEIIKTLIENALRRNHE